MNNKVILPIVILIVVLILGGFLFFKYGLKTNNSTQTNSNSNTITQPVNTTTATVNVTSKGYEPNELKVKIGARVVWTNNSGQTATVNSDPHPTHTLWPFLNLGSFDNGSSVSVVFTKSGKYTYHNHFNPEQKGTVIVE